MHSENVAINNKCPCYIYIFKKKKLRVVDPICSFD